MSKRLQNSAAIGVKTTVDTLTTNTIEAHVGSAITIPSDIILNGLLNVTGNVLISGSMTTVNTQELNVLDPYIYLGSNWKGPGSQTSGLVLNVTAGMSYTLTAESTFTPGVAGISNPSVQIDAVSGLANGQFITLTGSTDNEGIYEVLTHSESILTVRGVGLTTTIQPWSQRQFKSVIVPTNCQVTEVTVYVIRANQSNLFEVASGNTSSLIFKPVAHDGSNPTFNSVDLNGGQLTNSVIDSPVLVGMSVENPGDNSKSLVCVDELGLASLRPISSMITQVVTFTSTNGGSTSVTLNYNLTGKTVILTLSEFTHTMVDAGNTISASSLIYFNTTKSFTNLIYLQIEGIWEECLINLETSGGLTIIRKDVSNFPAGAAIQHGINNYYGSQRLLASLTYYIT